MKPTGNRSFAEWKEEVKTFNRMARRCKYHRITLTRAGNRVTEKGDCTYGISVPESLSPGHELERCDRFTCPLITRASPSTEQEDSHDDKDSYDKLGIMW